MREEPETVADFGFGHQHGPACRRHPCEHRREVVATVRDLAELHAISERLDSEQPSTKERADAIRKAARRSKEWIVDNLGKDAFEGFKVGLESIVKDNEEKVEGGAL